MPTKRITITGTVTRSDVREQVINCFISEIANSGKHVYNAEIGLSAHNITLHRPTRVGGFDYTVRVLNLNFAQGKFKPDGKKQNKRTNPTFKDLFDDLEIKKSEDPVKYNILYQLIVDVCDCKILDVNSVSAPIFSSGIPSNLMLGLFKWLLICEDLRYWLKKGRYFTIRGIPKP